MNIPDEIEIKAEIQKISERIDHILETVNRYHPLTNDSEVKETIPSDP